MHVIVWLIHISASLCFASQLLRISVHICSVALLCVTVYAMPSHIIALAGFALAVLFTACPRRRLSLRVLALPLPDYAPLCLSCLIPLVAMPLLIRAMLIHAMPLRGLSYHSTAVPSRYAAPPHNALRCRSAAILRSAVPLLCSTLQCRSLPPLILSRSNHM